MKYMVHSCNDRQWYVDEFLVPALLDQGISEEDIFIYRDKTSIGNLRAFYMSCKMACEMWGTDKKVCHLQDDVYPASYFRKEVEYYALLEEYLLICGFTCFYGDNKKPGCGIIIDDLWYSFPCIIIPNNIALEFYEWCDEYLWGKNMYKKWIEKNKGDDFIFKCFLEIRYPNALIYNVAPNLVEHIDYLLGGSVINKQRNKSNVRSMYWIENDLIKELEERLNKRIGGL